MSNPYTLFHPANKAAETTSNVTSTNQRLAHKHLSACPTKPKLTYSDILPWPKYLNFLILQTPNSNTEKKEPLPQHPQKKNPHDISTLSKIFYTVEPMYSDHPIEQTHFVHDHLFSGGLEYLYIHV